MFERAMKRGELPPGTDTTLLLELLVAPVLHRFFILHAPTDDERSRRTRKRRSTSNVCSLFAAGGSLPR
jgi:tetracycline repressor-like protein